MFQISGAWCKEPDRWSSSEYDPVRKDKSIFNFTSWRVCSLLREGLTLEKEGGG